MQALKLVLLFKILLTFVFWSLPLLVFPPSWLMAIGFLHPGAAIVFIRLLGAAYFTLGMGYVLGYRDLGEGKDIGNVVTVGIISNGLACIILLIFGMLGRWNDWGMLAQAFMCGSAVATGLITLGLIITGSLKDMSDNRLV
ncbi:MAG: hypothetical protein KME25_27545 [Symplocastrum torsivum CPER-KK1]|jgi:hypothetical protein|uniref:Uncharacterized protein n=1 Tax=Symplocastrum torsivum CPER-KK1 TaxID=450513 RepID=A0A951PQI8_9CYAN|nr:hypothetical protein [Symplocastrum torsivum CPER-KK1]